MTVDEAEALSLSSSYALGCDGDDQPRLPPVNDSSVSSPTRLSSSQLGLSGGSQLDASGGSQLDSSDILQMGDDLLTTS